MGIAITLTLMVLLVIWLLIHLLNIGFIVKKRHFRNSLYFLLINNSISDGLFVVFACINWHFYSVKNDILECISQIFYYSSIISTFLISLDRFIAIRFCFWYKCIVNDHNLMLCNIFIVDNINWIWIISIHWRSSSHENLSFTESRHWYFSPQFFMQ